MGKKKLPQLKDHDGDADDGDGQGSGDGDGSEDGGDGQDGDGDGGDGRTFTQDELSRYTTKSARQAAAKARRDLAEQLGVSLEDAAKIIRDHREAEEQTKDEITKAREAAAAATTQAAALEQDLKRERLSRQVGAALLKRDGDKPGCDPEVVDTITDLAVSFAIDAPDGEDDPVAWAVSQARTRIPHVFTSAGGSGADDDDSSGDNGRLPGGGRPQGQRRKVPKPLSAAEQARKALDLYDKSGSGEGRALWEAPPPSS